MPEVDSIPTWAPGASAISRLSRRAASRCRRGQSMDRSPVGAGIRPSWRRARAPLSVAGRVDRRGAREGGRHHVSDKGDAGIHYVADATPSRWGRDRESGGGGRSYESPPPPPPPYNSGGRDYLQRAHMLWSSLLTRIVSFTTILHPPTTSFSFVPSPWRTARCPRRRPCRSIPPARTEAREARRRGPPPRAMIERRWRSGRDRGRPKYDVRERDEGRGGMGGGGGGGGGGGDGTTTATQPRSPQPQRRRRRRRRRQRRRGGGGGAQPRQDGAARGPVPR